MIRKRLVDLTKDDIETLIREEAPESDSLEFKRELPAKNGVDKWMSSADKIALAQ